MRLATFNLLHGRSVDDQRVDEGRLRAAIRSLDADVLCLQEVDCWQPRSHRSHMTRVVAEAMEADFWRFEPTLMGIPGGAWRGREGGADLGAVLGHSSAHAQTRAAQPTEAAYGLGLVSRAPVDSWRVLTLPAAPLRSPVLMPGTGRPMLLTDEPRAALAAMLSTPDGPLTVVCTHLSFVPGWNAWQLRRLISGVADLPDPLVVLGDLNLPGPLPRLLTGWRQLARVATYPAWRPRVQFDHALARGGSWTRHSVDAVRLPISDHRALVVDATLSAARHG